MLARERQNTIVEIVNREGSVRVKNLSKKFGEETKMSKYKFAQRSGISLSTIYDIIRKEDYDIRESNIIKICHGMQIEPFDLFQTSEEILVLEKDEEIQAILEARSLPEEYREIMLEYLHSLKRIAERSK